MPRSKLEVAVIFHRHGEAWRTVNTGHVSLGQLRVMSAIEACRTATLGGHVELCADCSHTRIAYNSCRNRHCPKCQWSAAAEWLAARQAELLPVPYFHVVFTVPAAIGAIAYQNKAKVYGILFKAAAEALTTIAADPKHLGARIGLTACCPPGVRTSIIILMFTVSFRVAASHPTASAGLRAGQTSSYPFACCRAYSGACFCNTSMRHSLPASFSSSPISLRSNPHRHSSITLRRCVEANGWSLPSVHSQAPSKCLPISLGTPIASLSPTVG